jgi:hypothetical protein
MGVHLASRRGLLSSRVELPETVVFRAFATETIVLNLDTGRYHSLNPTGGRMLDALTSADSVESAARRLAKAYDVEVKRVADDLCDFCLALQSRGLIALRPPS